MSTFELSDLNGSNGFVLNGINAGDQSGRSVSAAGDVNGDGIDDILIGASSAGPNGSFSGESYVVFGSAAGFSASFELSSLLAANGGDGTHGFVLNGIDEFDFSGGSVSAAGDVNGDGIDDILIGASSADPNGVNSGESYVVFGSAAGFSASFELSSLLAANGGDGSNGVVLNGIDTVDNSGISVSAAGDVNGDGIDDILIGARFADPNGSDSGESYIVFGSATGFSASFELSSLLAANGGDGSNGFVLNGIDEFDWSGFSVSAAGDVNGDGIDDILIQARNGDPNGSQSGESYVVFGSAAGFPASFELSSLLAANGGDGSNGFVLNGIGADDYSGWSVSAAGDVNGDGIDDIIIAAPFADPNGSRSGESYVIFGSATGFSASFDLSSLLAANGGDGSNGFVLNGIDVLDQSGWSVSAAGDVNGDGIDDILIGAGFADPNGDASGESYIVFGSATGFSASFDLSSLLAANGEDGTTGVVLNGIDAGDRSGTSVSAAGDVNGDGIDDILIGAERADPNGGLSGESYVIFGSTSLGTPLDVISGTNGDDVIDGLVGDDIIFGLEGNDTINAASGNDTLNGGAGNDNLSGQGGNDTLNGGDDNDIIDGGNGADIIDGGAGNDTLSGGGGDDIIDGGVGIDTIFAGIGNDTAHGGGSNDTILGQGGNDTLYGDGGADTLRGGSGNDALYGGDGADQLFGQGNDDTLYGEGGHDTILGQGGADILYGGGAADTLRGGLGNDTLFGGDANDQLFGQGNNDFLYGEGGNDRLSGAAGSDQLFGGGGNDTLNGFIGADRLDGGAGNDVLNGGGMDGARDIFVFAEGYDEDRINAFDQAGSDRLELDDALWAAAGSLTAQEVVDMFGSLNATGSIMTLDFGNGDILEVQNAAGIDIDTFGLDIVII